MRVFRVSRIRGKVGYSSKAEHDFNRPEDFDPRDYADPHRLAAGRPDRARAAIWLSDRIDWLALRHFGHAGDGRPRPTTACSSRPTTPTPARWSPGCSGLGEHARVEGPPELVEEWRERLELVIERHTSPPELAAPAEAREARGRTEPRTTASARPPIRPERFARLVTLAGILIETAREGAKLERAELCERLQVTEQELRQDVDVLNVVNFGGGSYVLYAEVQGDQIEVDPEPYGDNFARPARLLPLEAKALVAAIDLIGEHLPGGLAASARKKIVDALGQDPALEGLQITTAKGDDSEIARVVSEAIAEHRLLAIEHYKERGRVHRAAHRALQADERPGGLVRARLGPREGRHCARSASTASASATCLDETLRAAPGHRARRPRLAAHRRGADARRRARVWMAPDRARWAARTSAWWRSWPTAR